MAEVITTVAVRNLSTAVPDDDVWEALEAFRHQANVNLARYWRDRIADRLPVELKFLADKNAVRRKGEWLAEIYDDAEQAKQFGVVNIPLDDFGYHSLTEPATTPGNGDSELKTPYMIVLAEESERAGIPWTVVFSHELLETLVDPHGEGTFFGEYGYTLEVCDPVWLHAYPITSANVWVSNFITPNWFRPGAHALYDFMGTLQEPMNAPVGGYVTTLYGDKATTKQMTASGLVTVAEDPVERRAGHKPRRSAHARHRRKQSRP